MVWPKQKPEDDDGVPFGVDDEIKEEAEYEDTLLNLDYDPPVPIPDMPLRVLNDRLNRLIMKKV